jgi:hypothetical protein
MSCQERSGFLFAHACDRPVAWSCTRCGKAICAEHTRMAEDGYTCITCLRLVQDEQSKEREEQEKKAEGDDTSTTDDPYFYADDGYRSDWDPSDRRAFRSSTSDSSSADEPEADFGAS